MSNPVYECVDIGDDGFPRYRQVDDDGRCGSKKSTIVNLTTPKIQVLVGMIASGKSTYAKNAARKGFICMNDDAIVNLLHADEYTLYSKSLKVLYKTIENQIIGTTLAMGRAVLIDRGLNCSIPGRQRWIALARSFDVDCEAIVFPHDGVETHARRRTDHDSRGHPYEYWLKVAKAHDEGYMPPSASEGFSAIHYVTFEEIKEGRVCQ